MVLVVEVNGYKIEPRANLTRAYLSYAYLEGATMPDDKIHD
jgi:hypothetical protein